MKLDVKFSEITTRIPAQFQNLQIVTNGVPPDEVNQMMADAEAAGEEIGKQAEYDRFWDEYQEYGTRTNYSAGFGGIGWNDDTFKPKYDIIPTVSTNLFYECGVTDLIKRLKDAGVIFDYSRNTGTGYVVQGGSITTFPTIDTRSRRNIDYFLSSDNLCYVEKVILKDDGSQKFNDFSFNLSSLEEIRFEGTIGSTINFQWSPLTNESLKSIITHLKNYAGTEQAYTCTVLFSSKCWENLDVEGETAPGGISWRRYVTEILCWNI